MAIDCGHSRDIVYAVLLEPQHRIPLHVRRVLKSRKNALKPLTDARPKMKNRAENRAALKELKLREIGLVHNY